MNDSAIAGAPQHAPLDRARIRREFPHLTTCVYLNTAAAGLAAPGQGEAVAAFYVGAKSRGMDGAEEWRGVGEDVRRTLGRLMDVPASTIGFASSTSEAMNLIARSVPFRRGDEVVVAEDEFPSVLRPWTNLGADGPAVMRVRVTRESERTAALADAITERTRVVT